MHTWLTSDPGSQEKVCVDSSMEVGTEVAWLLEDTNAEFPLRPKFFDSSGHVFWGACLGTGARGKHRSDGS